MLRLIVLSAVVAVALAAVSSVDPKKAAVLRLESDISPEGNYQWAYETENGISASENGVVKAVGSESPVVAQGSYQYQSPEGEQIQVQYVADENGYQPQGANIPTPPPVPAAILRALEWIAAHPEQPARKL